MCSAAFCSVTRLRCVSHKQKLTVGEGAKKLFLYKNGRLDGRPAAETTTITTRPQPQKSGIFTLCVVYSRRCGDESREDRGSHCRDTTLHTGTCAIKTDCSALAVARRIFFARSPTATVCSPPMQVDRDAKLSGYQSPLLLQRRIVMWLRLHSPLAVRKCIDSIPISWILTAISISSSPW